MFLTSNRYFAPSDYHDLENSLLDSMINTPSSLPLKVREKKKNLALGFPLHTAADKIHYGLKFLMVKLYYSIVVLMT